MKIVAHNHVVMCDVDSTLIMHLDKNDIANAKHRWISVADPITEGATISVVPNTPMIRLLKEELAAGKLVVVWSRGRYAWATNVLIALGLDHDQLVVMSKPETYFDDKDCSEWMGPRVYIGPDEIYKNKG